MTLLDRDLGGIGDHSDGRRFEQLGYDHVPFYEFLEALMIERQQLAADSEGPGVPPDPMIGSTLSDMDTLRISQVDDRDPNYPFWDSVAIEVPDLGERFAMRLREGTLAAEFRGVRFHQQLFVDIDPETQEPVLGVYHAADI